MAEKINTPPPPIGIDLGTENSCVGVWRNECVEIIQNQHGNKTTPSCVAFTDTQRCIGEAAKNDASRNPRNTILKSSTHPSIGIDLGTTNSCVGVWQDKWVKIIPNERGNTTTPSCVAFTDKQCYVGEAAEQQATTNPSNTILDVKRLIQKQFNSAKVQNDIKLLPLEVVSGPDDTPMISVQHQGQMQQHSASEISSMILHKLFKIAENFLACPIKNAVISVPACFNHSQRLAIVRAGNNVGLNVMRIINEPTAAAIAYGFNNINDCDGEKIVLIFDLGGGTLDVSILIIERGKYEVKATVGDSHLGGVDFDNQLMRHCIEELKREHSGKDLNLNSRAPGKLRNACKEAKIILSSTPEADIDIDSLLPGIHFQSCITRAKFEELNKDLFERCIDMVDKCLVDAKMYRSSIHDIVLIGGSTRIPKVKQMLREYFDGKELSMRINSDEAVACGAAIQAAIMSNMSDKVPNFVIHDITTHSLGIDIAKQVSMISRNSAIPITKKMILTADQIKFPIKVYEGEMTRFQDNHLLVEFPIQPDDPNGIIVGIDVCFNVNENGIFTISVEDKRQINRTEITCDSMFTTSTTKNSHMTLGDHFREEDQQQRGVETSYGRQQEGDSLQQKLLFAANFSRRFEILSLNIGFCDENFISSPKAKIQMI